MSETHDCPICAKKVAHSERFPKQVCERCQSRTSDAYGRRLSFTSDDVSGGLCAVSLDSGEKYARRLCYIDGRKCFANEHRNGGVVVETVKD